MSSEISRVLDILESAEDVISMDNGSLEPTPIGTMSSSQNAFLPPQVTISQLNDGSNFQDANCGNPLSCPSFTFDLFDEFSLPTPSPKRQRLSLPPKLLDQFPSSSEVLPCSVPSLNRGTQSLDSLTKNLATPSPFPGRFRQYQADQWSERFQDLIAFKEAYGHCLVPHNYPANQHLAQWIKRQRYQFKLKSMNRHSTLTDTRLSQLDEVGFVWDSHKAAWYERLESLKEYQYVHGHCNVPSNHEDRSLAIWVKCQRRQMKLFKRGAKSTMTPERFQALDQLSFQWNPRNLN